MKIGDLLLLKGYINKKQLTAALSKQAEYAINYDRSVPLGKILIEEGHVTVDEVAEALNKQSKEVKPKIKEERIMPTEIGETSKVTFDLKFLATIGVVIVSACATYFSITGQVDDNKKEIDNIKSMGDLKIISYKLEEYDETFKDLKSLSTTLSPLASDLTYIKSELNKLKNKKIDMPEIDLSGIEDCKDKIDALSDKISAFEERLTKVEKNSKGRF
jgi:polyhydroxyalkanoate synthesis regulator phasin